MSITMLFHDVSLHITVLIFALLLGFGFGAINQHIQLCLRRSLVGSKSSRRAAQGVWFAALTSAAFNTQIMIYLDWINFENSQFLSENFHLLGVTCGAIIFGMGAALARGCISRLVVLVGTGNLRALIVAIVFAVSAYATLTGILNPLKILIESHNINLTKIIALTTLSNSAIVWPITVIILGIILTYKTGAKTSHLILAALIGIMVPVGWAGTGKFLFDDNNPIAMQTLSYIKPNADVLHWIVSAKTASSGFGIGLIFGTIIGAATSALLKGQFKLQSFSSPIQTLRYILGAILMGFGGVVSGGCTIGAGFAGVPMLSLSAVFALLFMAIGIVGTRRLLKDGAERTGFLLNRHK